MSSMEGAACVGRWWLFDSTDPIDHNQARAICATCPVLHDCQTQLKYALSVDTARSGGGPTGTWAGLLLGRQGIKKVAFP